MRQATLRDVAQAAGVSVSTTSRIFREPERFREETRLRVLAAAAELDYQPNRAAQALITGRTGNVAVLVPNLTNPVFADLVRGVQHRLRDHSRRTLVADTDEDPEAEAELIRGLARDVDGIITWSSLLEDDLLAQLSKQVRLVFVGRDPGSAYRCVVADETSGMASAIAMLERLGHRSVTYLAGRTESWAARSRLRAFNDAVARSSLVPSISGPNAPSYHGGRRAAEELIASGSVPTAVMAFNDLIAIGVIAGLREAGLRVPDDVSVIGCDDIDMAQLTDPALTTLTNPMNAIGAEAADLVCSDDTSASSSVLELTLVERGTTGPARHSD